MLFASINAEFKENYALAKNICQQEECQIQYWKGYFPGDKILLSHCENVHCHIMEARKKMKTCKSCGTAFCKKMRSKKGMADDG